MVNKGDENRFISPVVAVDNNAWVRPGELLVEIDAEAALEERLRALGQPGQRYRPSPEPDRRDFRQRRGAPEYGDVNALLEEARFTLRLWTGLPHDLAVDLVRKRDIPGLHFHHVFVTADLYHGGPEGSPTAAAGPVGPVPTWAGDSDADIAVLDNGLPADWATLHPELSLAVDRYGSPTLSNDPLDEDGNGQLDTSAGHGAFICGLISRSQALLKVDLHRVLHGNGEGDEALIAPRLALLGSQVKVVNLSFGGFSYNDQETALMPTAVRSLVNSGKVVVAAAGNTGDDPALVNRPFWPAAMPEVIAVGAYDSRPGPPTPWAKSNPADIYAPGVDLLSSYVRWPSQGSAFNGWARWRGTSFAAPLVAAEIAARLSAAPSGLSPQQVVDDWRTSLGPVTWPHPMKGGTPARLYRPAKALTSWPW